MTGISGAPTSYVLGQTVRVVTHFTTVDGVTLEDPPVITFRVQDPQGNMLASYTYQASADIVRDGPGVYHADVLPSLVGVHTWRWEGSGINGAGVAPCEGNFRVLASQI